MARERVVDVYLPVLPDGGGRGCGVVTAMAALFGAVVLFALGVLVLVLVWFPSPDYSDAPVTAPVPVTTASGGDR